VPHREVAKYLAIADILVLSNSVKYEESSSYTSPMKALEYVASGKPIVASDVPALREVFHDHPVTFFTADDASSLAEAVMKARPSSGSSSQLLTWDQRAKMISEKFS
jgi:glycosyltransferase involved in cell wall biosynthesis